MTHNMSKNVTVNILNNIPFKSFVEFRICNIIFFLYKTNYYLVETYLRYTYIRYYNEKKPF